MQVAAAARPLCLEPAACCSSRSRGTRPWGSPGWLVRLQQPRSCRGSLALRLSRKEEGLGFVLSPAGRANSSEGFSPEAAPAAAPPSVARV